MRDGRIAAARVVHLILQVIKTTTYVSCIHACICFFLFSFLFQRLSIALQRTFSRSFLYEWVNNAIFLHKGQTTAFAEMYIHSVFFSLLFFPFLLRPDPFFTCFYPFFSPFLLSHNIITPQQWTSVNSIHFRKFSHWDNFKKPRFTLIWYRPLCISLGFVSSGCSWTSFSLPFLQVPFFLPFPPISVSLFVSVSRWSFSLTPYISRFIFNPDSIRVHRERREAATSRFRAFEQTVEEKRYLDVILSLVGRHRLVAAAVRSVVALCWQLLMTSFRCSRCCCFFFSWH